tara:strand:+ start:441 stop:2078 length:1638 start_codon:yes stop_codon:yes gene_type:complete
MSEATITATPVNAPDVLLNQPMSRQVDVELETKILEPVSHRYTSATGGRTTYILPASGVLDAPNCALVWELTADEGANVLTYPAWSGGLAMIEQITCRVGGQILSQVENAHRYATIRNNFKSQAEKEGVLDLRHGSMNKIRNRPSNAVLATASADRAFHQIYNVDTDQVAEYGYNYANGIAHTQQISKSLGNTAGQSFECVVRLSDVFKFFDSNRLPLLAMAQVEIEVIWAKCGDPNVAAVNIEESAVIERPIPINAANRARQGTVTMTNSPTLICDYIHYDDVEKQRIFDAINSGGGMALNFTEVVVTRGVNPASTVSIAAGTDQYEMIESNHIIGMAMKEVKKIYVWKEFDITSPDGIVEIDGDYNQVYTHRSIVDNSYKSQQIPGEKYNFIINNQRIYSRDVDNVALQHNYLSQCHDEAWNCVEPLYDTANYNFSKCAELLDTSWASGVATQTIDSGRSKPFLAGSQNVLGLNLDKYNASGNTPGNGMRISSAPIEFQYSRVAIGVNGSAANSLRCPVNLTFFIEYRRSLIIRPLGIDVSDA